MLTSKCLSKNPLTYIKLFDIIGGGKNLPPLVMEENINNYIESHVRGGMGNDHITFNLNMSDDIIKQSPSTPWKYNEEEIVKELLEYIRGTYNQHYSAGDQKIQTLDLIEACGDGEAFCRSNILKYASRYDKKGSARRDIMKILHYAVLLMNYNDKNAVRETYNQ
jgi:hypothetical protein